MVGAPDARRIGLSVNRASAEIAADALFEDKQEKGGAAPSACGLTPGIFWDR